MTRYSRESLTLVARPPAERKNFPPAVLCATLGRIQVKVRAVAIVKLNPTTMRRGSARDVHP